VRKGQQRERKKKERKVVGEELVSVEK